VDDVLDNLCIYVDPLVKTLAIFSGGLVKISLLSSPSKPPVVPEKDKDASPNDAEFSIAKAVVVKVQVWEEAPEGHVGISPRLANTLGVHGLGDLARYSPSFCTHSRISPAGSPVKKLPPKLIYHPFSKDSEKSNALRVGGDKARQKEEANAKEKETVANLQQSLKHIFNSPITEGMRVSQEGDIKHSGIISFSGHAGEWFQPRNPEDFTFSIGRDIPDNGNTTLTSPISSRKIVSIEKLLNKAEKTLKRNGSVLVCGGRGSGKSATLKELSTRLYTNLFCILSN
jgi:hypothetical protein